MVIRPVVCPVFVGRSAELAALHAARRALAHSRGGLIVIGGESGIGKSRLLEKFVRDVPRTPRHRAVVVAECLEFAEQPFGPFRQLFADLTLEFPGSDDPSINKREIFERVARAILSRAMSRATILAIEDLHWADRSSLELLSFIAPRLEGSRVLFIATYRSEEVHARPALGAALARMRRESTVTALDVTTFDRADLEMLFDHMVDARWTGTMAARDAIVARSEGNPFFAEELLKDALEGKAGGAAVPFSIRASVLERLATFDEQDRVTLGHAAVLGYRFDAELLALSTGAPIERVLETLRRACASNVLVEDETFGGPFRFRHALTRDVVYAALLRYDVKRIHARILAMLEGLPESERNLEALAYHAWAAGDRDKSVVYNRLASRSALTLRALPEARTFAERVAAMVPPESLAHAEALAALAVIEDMAGDIEAADEHYRCAAERFCALGDFDRAAEAMRGHVACRNNLADTRCVAIGRSFVDVYGTRITQGPRDQLIALLARLSAALYDMSAIRELLGSIEAPAALPPRARMNFNVANMALHHLAGDEAAWLVWVPLQLRLLAELPPYHAVIALYSIVFDGLSLGSTAVVDDALERASRIEQQWEFSAISAYGAALRAAHATNLGRLQEARSELTRALRAHEVSVATGVMAAVAPVLASALHEPGLVTPELEQHVAELRAASAFGYDDAPIFAAFAGWSAERGRLNEARADLRMALACLERPSPKAIGALVYAATLLEGDDLEPLHRLLREPLAPSDRAIRAAATLARAILAQRFGDAEHGRSLAADAAAAFRQLGWPIWEIHARRTAGDAEGARVIARRIGAGDAHDGDVSVAPGPRGLSGREHAVAIGIVDGATNAEIAERLSISDRTVEKHVASIFRKLAVRNRAQVAVLFAEAGRRLSR